MKDLHFNILSKVSPYNYNIENIQMCLPFSFYIKGNTTETIKIFIEIFDDCFNFFNKEKQDFIKSHLDKPLLTINGLDPLECIQNLQSEFNSLHNKHAQFSYNLENAHKLSFNYNPVSEEKMNNIEFIFEGGDNLTLDYYINYKEENNLKENINEDSDLKNWKYSTKK